MVVSSSDDLIDTSDETIACIDDDEIDAVLSRSLHNISLAEQSARSASRKRKRSPETEVRSGKEECMGHPKIVQKSL